MWPWFKSGFDRRLNRSLLMRQLKRVAENLPTLPVVVTTLPITADLIGRLPAAKWVYYCVDDFSKWPGLDQAAMDRMERLLVSKVDRIIAVSETLQDRLRMLGRDDAELLTHGVDTEFWKVANVSPRSEIKIVFWGVIDRRMDVEFVRQLATDLTEGTIILVGPENDPDPTLKEIPRVKILPPMSFEELPKLAAESNVLVMPYADLPVTRAIQPLKLKEYLATGKPVVVRDLPANRVWADALDLAVTPAEFSRIVRERIRSGVPEKQISARQKLVGESWAAKARQLEEWVCEAQPTKKNEEVLDETLHSHQPTLI
jgi:glycosyltransferase involved in cell wall biosynthesis